MCDETCNGTRECIEKPRWITFADASKYLGVSDATLSRAAKRGELKTVRIGRAVRIVYESLDAFAAKLEGGNGGE